MPSREEYEAEAKALGLDPGEYVSAMMGTPEPAPRVAPAVEAKKTAAETKKAVPEFSPPPTKPRAQMSMGEETITARPQTPPTFAPAPISAPGWATRPDPAKVRLPGEATGIDKVADAAARVATGATEVYRRVTNPPMQIPAALPDARLIDRSNPRGPTYTASDIQAAQRAGQPSVFSPDIDTRRAEQAAAMGMPTPAVPAPLVEPTYGEKVDAIAQAYGATTEQVQRLIRDGKIDIDAGYLNAVQKLTGK